MRKLAEVNRSYNKLCIFEERSTWMHDININKYMTLAKPSVRNQWLLLPYITAFHLWLCVCVHVCMCECGECMCAYSCCSYGGQRSTCPLSLLLYPLFLETGSLNKYWAHKMIQSHWLASQTPGIFFFLPFGAGEQLYSAFYIGGKALKPSPGTILHISQVIQSWLHGDIDW